MVSELKQEEGEKIPVQVRFDNHKSLSFHIVIFNIIDLLII